MSTSGPLKPRRADGTGIDATFELSVVPVFDVIYHHKAGARGSDRSVNADYHEGLELLLGRMAELRLTILGVAVDSAVARELDPADRELDLEFPIDLSPAMNVPELRLQITRAQKPVARRPNAAPGGGNDQKRIRITLTSDDPTLSFDAVRQQLIGEATLARPPARELDDSALDAARATHSSARRALPKVKDLLATGMLLPGTVVHATARGREWRATIFENGEALLEGDERPRLFGKLTDEVAGHSESAMRLWTIERDGTRVPLGALRDELAAQWDLGNG